MAKKKIYAVRKGLRTGIFETWEECKSAIEGFSGAEYKGFSKMEDAKSYLNYENVTLKNKMEILDTASNTDCLIAYIDGSFSEEFNKYGYGCVFLTPQKEIIKELGYGEDKEALLIRNVAGELKGALYATLWAMRNGYNKIVIRHDYEGIAKWALGEWKAKNKIAQVYIEEMQKFMERIDISFEKVDAHTNDPFNDQADKLAKEAISTTTGNHRVNRGGSWASIEGVLLDDLVTVIKLVEEDISDIQKSESDIPHGKKFELVIPRRERIVINYYTDKNTLSIQGKPKKIFASILSYITELTDIEKIPELFNSLFELDISKENVKTEFRTYLPNAYGNLPPKLERVLHQAVYNLNIHGDFFEATFLAEPVLRALEGHLKLVLINSKIDLKTKHDGFYMFKKVGHKYQLNEEFVIEPIEKNMEGYIGRCYTHYNKHRNTLSHWDDPTDLLDTTRLISDPNQARQLIKDTLLLIDEYYSLL